MTLAMELLEPTNPANAAVIWLHGLGASGHDFVPIIPHLGLPQDHGIRFLFPHAPEIPVTCNGGYVMPAWYDILALTEIRQINGQHLANMRDQIVQIIEQQIAAGIDSKRIILIGFSQGGALAYHSALTFDKPLGGLIALSTYLPLSQQLTPEQRAINKNIPVRIAHGTQDEMVTLAAGQSAHEWLQQAGYQVEWKDYPMGHEVCMPEIKQLSTWLTQLLT